MTGTGTSLRPDPVPEAALETALVPMWFRPIYSLVDGSRTRCPERPIRSGRASPPPAE
jgi:hypothetical protein